MAKKKEKETFLAWDTAGDGQWITHRNVSGILRNINTAIGEYDDDVGQITCDITEYLGFEPDKKKVYKITLKPIPYQKCPCGHGYIPKKK